ncbi:MAG: acyl-CoA carboxylase subunit beta [Thermodesulfobacteriota bacterium]|nr:acyl-CoA carboxylase subunit beta [Thermodesulfobacteriota bacterium]
MDEKMERRIKSLREIREKAKLGGGEEKIAKVHAKGKLSARERLDKLLDPGSFVDLGLLVGYFNDAPGDGIVAGYGTINGRMVSVYAQDPTVLGGSIGGVHGNRMYRVVERAMDMRIPFIGLHDSPGARLPKLGEGQTAMGGGGGGGGEKHGGSVFSPNTWASGVIPQISAILGSCAGIAVYSPALTDFIFMVDKLSNMFITGPRMVKTVMGETLTDDELGGAAIHCAKSGVADMRLPSEEECFATIRDLISFLPPSCDELPPRVETGDDPDRYIDDLADMVPSDPSKAFDMRKVVRKIVDNGHFLEIKPEFAREIIVGFGRLDGHTVGIVANNSMFMAGSLTVDSSDKQARFMRFCDCFNIPIALLIDTSAYMPGSDQEHKGIIRHGAKVLYALCEATVPRISIIMRKAYGGGNLGMGCIPGMGTDLFYNWPIMEVGVMGAKASVELMYAADIMKAENPDEVRAQKLLEYEERYSNPMRESSANPYGDTIEPRETRRVLINGFKLLAKKKVKRPGTEVKKHGNMPL